MTRSSFHVVLSDIPRIPSFEHPTPCVLPHSLHRTQFQSQRVGGLLVSHPKEELELDDGAQLRLDLFQLDKQFVNRQGHFNLGATYPENGLDFLKGDGFGFWPARMVD